MSQFYIIDSTLINSNLIVLDKFVINPIPTELQQNKNVKIKLITGENTFLIFDNCHIDNTKKRRLHVPNEFISWIRCNFPFSVAYFESHYNEQKIGIWKKEDVNTFNNALNKEIDKKSGKPIKMDIPGETIVLSWVNDEAGNYILIQKGFAITQENATEYLSEKALASVLPYIFSSVANTSATLSSNGKKCFIIDQTTKWLSVEQYSETAFSHPGLYLLRRKTENGDYAYYIGKAADIKSRIVKNKNKVSHPDEKYEDKKQYDDIACISIVFDQIAKLFGNNIETPANNPAVNRGSDIDNALYAVEDIVIHTVAMILLSDGKRLDNKQYREYTSRWIDEKS